MIEALGGKTSSVVKTSLKIFDVESYTWSVLRIVIRVCKSLNGYNFERCLP